MNGYLDRALRDALAARPVTESIREHMDKDEPAAEVVKLATWLPVTDEMLIDAGLGTPEMIARDNASRAAAQARWLALPFYVRWSRRARSRWSDFRYRLDRAIHAFRDEDFE